VLLKSILVGCFIVVLGAVISNAEDKLPPEDQALQIALNRFTQCQIDNITNQQDQARVWLGQYNRLVAEQERLKKELLTVKEKSSPKEEK
jgi:hypothetical protein